MLYKALKPCRFDKFYCVGDTIPGHVIDPGKANTLIKEQGIIVPIEGTEDETPQEMPQETIEVNEAVEGTEDETPQEKYTKVKLMELKKDELIELAAGMGLPVDEEMTKAQISDAILLAQE